MNGMGPLLASKRAGHSEEIQKKSYRKYDGIRARDLVDKHL